MTSGELLDVLRSQYPAAHGWLLLPQVRDATGAGAGRTADAIAMQTWPSRGLELHGFELKVSRGDWLRELKKPAKAESIYKFCDRWFVVVPGCKAERAGASAIVRPAELPKSWGLLVCEDGKVVGGEPGEALKPKPLDRAFLAAVLRRVAACETPEARLAGAFQSGHVDGIAEGRRMERMLMEHRSQRQELVYQRDGLRRLEEIAGRCLKSIRHELLQLKELGASENDDAEPAEAP